MAAQPTRQQRLAWADHVIENAGTLEKLSREVDELWATFITSNDDRHTG
jgi:dephospho-CoA kinase